MKIKPTNCYIVVAVHLLFYLITEVELFATVSVIYIWLPIAFNNDSEKGATK